MKNRYKPAHVIRLGSLKLAIWHDGHNALGKVFSVSIQCQCSNTETWQVAEEFSKQQLVILKKLSELALDWISEQNRTPPEIESNSSTSAGSPAQPVLHSLALAGLTRQDYP